MNPMVAVDFHLISCYDFIIFSYQSRIVRRRRSCHGIMVPMTMILFVNVPKIINSLNAWVTASTAISIRLSTLYELLVVNVDNVT